MIIPFIYDFSPTKQADQLWAFFSSLSMQKKTRGAIIAPEHFFDTQSWRNNDRQEAISREWASYYCYDLPCGDDLTKIQKIMFPDDIIRKIAAETGSLSAAAIKLHRENCEPLVRWLVETFDKLKVAGQHIDAVMVLGELPSVNEACRRCNTKVIHFEWGPLRPATYLRTAYWDQIGIIAPSEIAIKYKEFKRIKHQLPMLNKKALLALFLKDEFCECIQFLDVKPEYEIGLCAQEEGNYRIQALGYKGNADMIAWAQERYSKEEILFRDRPSVPLPAIAQGIEKDMSLTPSQFICRCKRIVSIHSNMAFEAMLWGKPSYILGEMPYKIEAYTDLDFKEENPVQESFLNFVLFAFLVPYQRLWDIKYMTWRLTEPSIKDIYLSNLNFYCELQGLDAERLKDKNFSAEEILWQKKCGAEGQKLGIKLDNLQRLSPDLKIRKMFLKMETKEAQAKLFCIQKDNSFEVSFVIPKAGKIYITFVIPAGGKISVDASSSDGAAIKIHPINAEKDNVSFCKENPIYQANVEKNDTVLILKGVLIEIEPFVLALERMFEEQNNNWQLSMMLEREREEKKNLEQYLQEEKNQNEQLRVYSEQCEKNFFKKDQWIQKLEMQVVEKDKWQKKLEGDIQEQKSGIAEERKAWASEKKEFIQENECLKTKIVEQKKCLWELEKNLKKSPVKSAIKILRKKTIAPLSAGLEEKINHGEKKGDE